MEDRPLETNTPLVIRVSVKSNTESSTPTLEWNDGNSITLDTFVCGHCQSEFVDITEFLGHRLQHKLTSDSYRCELCKASFAKQNQTTEHYFNEHKVVFTSHYSRQSTDNTQEVTAQVIHVNAASPSADKDLQSQDVTITVVEQSITDNGSSSERVDDVSEAENQSDLQPNINIEHEVPDGNQESQVTQMLKFRLDREEVIGTKFKYSRQIYGCLHCRYHAYHLKPLISHVQKTHPNNECSVDVQASIDNNGFGGSVLTVGQYYAMTAKKKEVEQTLSKLKRSKKRLKQDQCRIYVCHTCKKVFQRARSLRLHMEIHRTERNYLCDECGKAFKSQIRLNAHRKVHREKLFQCSQCEFQSSVNSTIHIHRQFHRDGCVLCHVCGSAYTDKSTLKKHMQVHSVDRPYGCGFEGCTWRFKTQAMCKAHLRAHTTKGKFQCTICRYIFRHKHHLQRHEATMHGVISTKMATNSILHVEASRDEQGEDASAETSIQVVPVQVVVATDMQGTPITYEQPELVDVNHLSASNYNQVLIHTSEHSQIFSAGQE